MNSPEFNIVIPVRYASTRFPGKPLHLLNGRPMILHTADRARESSAASVVIATDDERIRQVCEAENLQVVMTDEAHPSGTDRIAEVAHHLKWSADTLIVGLQGDEPATEAQHLDLLASNLEKNENADMATLCMPIVSREDFANPNRVKVVRDYRNMALYFSRAEIPAQRHSLASAATDKDDGTVQPKGQLSSLPEAFLHIGLYAYRCHYLKKYQQLPPCKIEIEEQLEQLRVLYHGGKIHVDAIETGPARGVDHPDDVPALEDILAARTSAGLAEKQYRKPIVK